MTQEAHKHLAGIAKRLLAESRYDETLAAHHKAQGASNDARKAHDSALLAYRAAEYPLASLEASLAAAEVTANPFVDQRHALQDRLSQLHQDERVITKELEAVEAENAYVTPWVSGFRDIRLIVLDDLLGALSVLTTSYANDLGLSLSGHVRHRSADQVRLAPSTGSTAASMQWRSSRPGAAARRRGSAWQPPWLFRQHC